MTKKLSRASLAATEGAAMRERHETVNEITSSALTKAFLNCNELPKSELCAVQVPSSPRRTPSYKTPPYTRMCISWHPCGRSATPRHEYIYIDRPSRHFSFRSSLCSDEPKCVHPFDTLFISMGRDVSVFSSCSFHRTGTRV